MTSGTATITTNSTSATFTVSVSGDTTDEANETFNSPSLYQSRNRTCRTKVAAVPPMLPSSAAIPPQFREPSWTTTLSWSLSPPRRTRSGGTGCRIRTDPNRVHRRCPVNAGTPQRPRGR